MTNDLPGLLRSEACNLGGKYFQLLMSGADEIDRLAREENALRGAYSAVLFERDALRSRLEKAEDVCQAIEASDYQIELYCDVRSSEDCDHCVIKDLVQDWRSARDAKPKEGG